MKNKKGITIFSILIISIITMIIGGGGYYVYKTGKFPLFQNKEYPGTGCQLIGNEIIEKTGSDADFYMCNYDECIVSGRINIEESQIIDTLTCSDCLYNDGRNKAVRLVNQGMYEYYERCDNPIDNPSKDSGWWACSGSISEEYKADWNFCPIGSDNFEYCNGNLKTIYGEGNHKTTQQEPKNYKLIHNQGIHFNPEYPNSDTVSDRSLYIENYDCSCSPAVDEGIACDINQKLCTPEGNNNLCDEDEGYYFTEENTHCVSGEVLGYRRDICAKRYSSTSNNYDCRNPRTETDYTIFKRCDSTQSIGQSTCGDWGTEDNCPTGQKCIVTETGDTGYGVGTCGCESDVCYEGERIRVDEHNYKECILIGGCYDWGITTHCPGTLVYNDVIQECVCPDNPCSITDPSICLDSNTVQSCELYENGGKLCSRLKTDDCIGEKECSNGACSCEGVNECSFGEIQCIDDINYKSCTKENSESCYKMRDNGGSCESNEVCKNNVCELKPGCANRNDCEDYETCDTSSDPNGVCVCIEGEREGDLICHNKEMVTFGCNAISFGLECSNIKDTNDINIEFCSSNNICEITSDDYTALELEFIQGRTICRNNNIFGITKYSTDNNPSIYRWELKENCDGGTPYCLEI